MKTESEIKQKIREQVEILKSSDTDTGGDDMSITEYQEISNGIMALQWVVSIYNKGEQKMAMNENNTKRLKTMEKNVTEGLGLVADYKPNRISFYILLLASGRTEQLRDVLYKDMEKYRSEESKISRKNMGIK